MLEFDDNKYNVEITVPINGKYNSSGWISKSPIMLHDFLNDSNTFIVQLRKNGYETINLKELVQSIKLLKHIENQILFRSDFEIKCGYNLFDRKSSDNMIGDGENGWYLSSAGVTQITGHDFSVSHYMKISGNKKIFLRSSINGFQMIKRPAIACAFYDKNKNLISIVNSESDINTPDNAAYMRICVATSAMNMLVVTLDAPTDIYVEYVQNTQKKGDYKDTDDWEIIMPSNLYIAANVECNICPQNISRYFDPLKLYMYNITGFTNVYNSFRLKATDYTENFESYIKCYKDSTKRITKAARYNVKIVKSTSGTGKNKKIL